MHEGDGTPWKEVARRQHGAIHRRQLLACGFTTRTIATAVARGALLRVAPGVYLVADPEIRPTWEREVWVALLDAGDGSFVYRSSAARIWELDGVRPGPIELASVGTRHPRRPNLTRLQSMPAGDLRVAGGIPVTSPLRTLLDIGSAWSDPDLLRAVECCLRRQIVDEAELRSVAGRARTRGAGALRRVLTDRPEGAPATESDAETQLLLLALTAGLPQPERQRVMRLGGKRYRLDLAWPAVRLASECDGVSVHGPDALTADLRRQNAILLDDWMIVRFVPFDIRHNGRTVQQVLEQAYEMQASRALGSSLLRP